MHILSSAHDRDKIVWVISFFLLMCMLPSAAIADSASATNARISSAMQGSERFRTTRSLDDLQSSVNALGNATDTRGSVNDNIANRRSIVKAFSLLFKQIDASVDPTFNSTTNVVDVCLTPPADRQIGLPSCADPADIKDPQIRATYIAALKANSMKIERNNLQVGLPILDLEATADLKGYIANFRRSHTPDDFQSLSDIVQNAGVSVQRRMKIETILRN